MSRLKNIYYNEIIPKLMKINNIKNIMEVPSIKKITLNMGVGEAINDKKYIDNAFSDLFLITGQKPVVTKAKKSIAGFKVREGWPIGCMVTLRSVIMYEFLDRLLSIVIPRIRDFRGLNINSFDGRGNYNFGIKEQIVFPEIDYDKMDRLRGLDICITTKAKNDNDSLELLKLFKFPFLL